MELLEKYFDVAFAAPEGIKKLRELILTLAMQGKLVSQDPNDQPASELLKEIEAEKRRLVKSGKIKLQKPLPEIKSEEQPYELPVGWEWVRLGEIGYLGSSSRVHQRDWRDEGVPFFRAREIVKLSKLGFVENELFISEEHYQTLAKNGLTPEADDLMITGVGTIGVPYIVKKSDRFYFKDASVLIFKNLYCLYAPFLLRFLKSSYWIERIHDGSMGTTVHTLTIGRANEILVPLPPLAEQHRIVARIVQLMALCDELEKLRAEREEKRLSVHISALSRLFETQGSDSFADAWHFINRHFSELYAVKANVTELRKAILQLGVMGKLVPQDSKDEPVENLLTKVFVERKKLTHRNTIEQKQQPTTLGYEIPESWKWQNLGNILVFGPTNGFSPKSVEYETSVRSLTLTATTSGVFKGEYSKFISCDIPFDSELWLRDGDILVQRGNTLEYVGVPAVYRGKPNCFIHPDLMMKLRVSSEINTSFIYFAMSSEPCREFLRCRASGTSGTMPKINQATLKSLPVPIPPLAEQHRIVAKIDQLMALCDQLEQQIDATASKQSALLNAVMAVA